MIYDHNGEAWRKRWRNLFQNKYNGAYYYSREIVSNIIPNVETSRNWITVNDPDADATHSIVFIHSNDNPRPYEWLKRFDDTILVCGVPETVEKVSYIGRAVYLPLSIDTAYVKRFASEKTRDAAYIGRLSKLRKYGATIPEGVDTIGDMERSKLLKIMSQYRNVYAVGRTAIEARCLGAEILLYDPRYPDPSIWEVIDNLEAAKMLQGILDKIDK